MHPMMAALPSRRLRGAHEAALPGPDKPASVPQCGW